MSGRRIDDHKFWAGSAEKGVVFPDGSHKLKQESSDGHEGHIGSEYSDTTEMVRRDQEHGAKKAAAHKIKPGYRY